jgi:hypothetical protein
VAENEYQHKLIQKREKVAEERVLKMKAEREAHRLHALREHEAHHQKKFNL